MWFGIVLHFFLFLKIQLLFFFINSFVLNTDFLFHLCHVLLSIRIYYKYPVEAKKRENSLFSFFRFSLFAVNHLSCNFHLLYRHSLEIVFSEFFFSTYQFKIRKQDGFVSVCVWFRFVCCYLFCGVSRDSEDQHFYIHFISVHVKLDSESKLKWRVFAQIKIRIFARHGSLLHTHCSLCFVHSKRDSRC